MIPRRSLRTSIPVRNKIKTTSDLVTPVNDSIVKSALAQVSTEMYTQLNTKRQKSSKLKNQSKRQITNTAGKLLNPIAGTSNASKTTSDPVAAAVNPSIAQSTRSQDPTENDIDTNTNRRYPKRNKTVKISNVVKEVEKLHKNREVIRQKHAAMKEEKKALMNLDPGNKNWEILAMIRDFRSEIKFKPLMDKDPIVDHPIIVCVRKRPINRKELARKEVDIITIPDKDLIIFHEPKIKVDLTKYLDNQSFRFDYAFNEDCTNETVYKYSAKPLVVTVFEGGMATCFAYGQTGSGKTHTMSGDFEGAKNCETGIYAMVVEDVFDLLHSPKYNSLNLTISASFFEIYSGTVFDLLGGKNKLRVLEDGKQQVQIVGLTETLVNSVEEVLKLIKRGTKARTSRKTKTNYNSSRSHAIFQIILYNPERKEIHGKFSLIDLAGNERGIDNASSKLETRMEGAEINKSLLALKECIRALERKSSHLPFRASKLTHVLRDSFIGDKSKTCMIAMISPGLSSCEQSLNTLRYAQRVKEIDFTDTNVDNKQLSPNIRRIEDESYNFSVSFSDSFSDIDQSSNNIENTTFTLSKSTKTASGLQEVENEVIDLHKAVLELDVMHDSQSKNLYFSTGYGQYDQDAYAHDLKELISKRISIWSQLEEKVEQFAAEKLEMEKNSANDQKLVI